MIDKKQQTIDSYNASFETIAAKFDAIGPRVDDIRRTLSYVTAQNPRVVEIGCGNGRDAEEIVKYTHDYVGFDVSEKMIELARKKIPAARFEVADAEAYRFPAGTDAIFSFASLLHSPRQAVAAVLENARGSMHDDAVFLLSLKKAEQYREETVNDDFGTRTFYLYTPEVIRELAGDGFETVYEDHQDKGRWKWFTQILRKKS